MHFSCNWKDIKFENCCVNKYQHKFRSYYFNRKKRNQNSLCRCSEESFFYLFFFLTKVNNNHLFYTNQIVAVPENHFTTLLSDVTEGCCSNLVIVVSYHSSCHLVCYLCPFLLFSLFRNLTCNQENQGNQKIILKIII